MTGSPSPSFGPSDAPLDPLALLAVAANLATYSPDEAHLRAAIGRVYYALYLIARNRTQVTVRRGAHDLVLNELTRQGYQGVASKIGQIRHFRDLADYELLPTQREDRNWAWNWRYVTSIATLALAEMEEHGWITSAPRLLVPTEPRDRPRP